MVEATHKKLLHTRQISCQGFELGQGRWQVIGRMADVKSFAMHNPDRGGQISIGEPLHDISLTLTLDRTLLIEAVDAEISAAPFNSCYSISQAFQRLVGLRLLPGFSREAKELLGGVKGCTHLLELLGPIATTAYQTLWQSEEGYNSNDPQVTEFLLNSCHSLRDDGEVVRQMAPSLAKRPC
ncbi:MAG: DUF2889 domain-containing protein [Motiliproteus sp.]